MSLKKDEQKAAQQKRRRTPEDPREMVDQFTKKMSSALDEILKLFDKYKIPKDWFTFDPCDDEGYMLWMWIRPKNRYWLRVTVSADTATADCDTGEILQEVSFTKAVRRLKRMMDDDEDEEEDSEEDDD